MSRKFRDKGKDLISLTAVPAEEVWNKSKGRPGKFSLRKEIDIYGRIDKGSSSFVTKTNLKGTNHKFVEDTSNLPKKTKQKIIDMFKNDNKKVVYLVKENKKRGGN